MHGAAVRGSFRTESLCGSFPSFTASNLSYRLSMNAVLFSKLFVRHGFSKFPNLVGLLVAENAFLPGWVAAVSTVLNSILGILLWRFPIDVTWVVTTFMAAMTRMGGLMFLARRFTMSHPAHQIRRSPKPAIICNHAVALIVSKHRPD